MKRHMLFLLTLIVCGPAFSQSAVEKNAIMQPVRDLFQGMNKGDSALAHGAFTREVSFVSVFTGSNGKPVLQPDALGEFLVAVGTPHTETWNELIWDEVIQADGNFAQVWAPYAFYAGKKFSHCGVDTFHLFKGEDGRWRIFHLADTRRKEGCDVPKAISDRFK